MGKRKERRLAALSNAGRRVKLDLFAEPSGDLGGSSENDKVGGDANRTQQAGLPNSPSSSGLQPQNPLLLLEQYSDDELNEGASTGQNHAVAEGSPSDRLDQDELLSEEKSRQASTVEDSTTQEDKQQEIEGDFTTGDGLQRLEGDDTKEKDTSVSADICNSTEQVSDGPLHSQFFGDVTSGWRIVMHEESNQYYYWNIETGETSWEVPAALIQATQLTSDPKALTSGEAYSDPVVTNISSLGSNLDNPSAASTIDGWMGGSYIHESKELYGNATSKDELVEGYKSESLKNVTSVADVDQSESQGNLTAVTAFQGVGSVFVSDHLHDAVTSDEHKEAIDLSSSLMKQCESLLERLKSLKGYGCHPHDQLSKYSLELELRLSDIKALSSHGSSLLPFWNHSEKQLKQLEDSINNDIYQLAVSAQMADDIGVSGNTYSEVKQELGEKCLMPESEVHAEENSRKSDLFSVSLDVGNKSHDAAAEGTVVSVKDDSSLASLVRHLECGTAANEVNRDADLKPELSAGEDVDMDVDMEVEDGVNSSISTVGDALRAKTIASNDQLIQANPPTDLTSLTSEGTVAVPLPPEEEWVPPPPPDVDQAPPPPPDDEQIPPPPPPDEPLESSYPLLPTYTETGQPPSYVNHCNLTYPTSDFQYYGDGITMQTSNFYGHADGNQLAVSHTSHLYGTVPITYAETAATLMGPPEPVGYYNLPDGSMPLFPVVNTAGSSQLHVPGMLCNETLSSDQIRQVDDPAEAIQTSNVSVVGHGIDVTSVLAPSTMTTFTYSNTSTMKESSTLSADPASDTAVEPSTTAKSQPKVVRTKKRTVAVAPSLRSNKKVSNLVDKWKAAKEELNENEDEPDNPYEILEKKRQREIEEWHAKQIASGEAKDNANFQPLGGDWRERVKRRRAQAAKEAKKNPVDDKTQAQVVPESQQPDLADLAKGLPSGWQAYWDEGSKQVYYGNTLTSQTTWTRPTK
ncbi:hypothetical protein K2173_015519 [Erythroxylum novogranatense]|uniref:WW domain-containing protein n=1 Tax=Erythroxylum novogranatense TaxID=1862640 RepID=A0AAV8SRV2_9ROSI|nr:hypothetical protein K2173_015519 [Erythroxylum novogranatense]